MDKNVPSKYKSIVIDLDDQYYYEDVVVIPFSKKNIQSNENAKTVKIEQHVYIEEQIKNSLQNTKMIKVKKKSDEFTCKSYGSTKNRLKRHIKTDTEKVYNSISIRHRLLYNWIGRAVFHHPLYKTLDLDLILWLFAFY